MGTRSLTYIFDEYNNPLVCMYRQWDGYPAGHGADLAEFLNSGKMVNGISVNETEKVFNGMGCMAAQMVSHFKQDSAGNFYLYPTNDLSQDCYQEYEYHVYPNRVVVYEGQYMEDNVIFEGNWHKFASFCNGEEEKTGVASTPFVDDPVTRNWLKGLLHDGEVEITFTKKDGSDRVMKCTLDEDVVPPSGAGKTVNRSDDVQPVYDVEAQGWRSFRWDSVKSITFGV